ncbi:unnamed protein product [Ilex paraguariensis]|uniref:Uncharacterized protein n=1 Tax=Ilex paraguariensis TaxID=185542 RepID=A0ABC8SHJ9_9AQUA
MNPINGGTIKKSLGQGKNKKTQPQQSLGKEKNKKTQPQQPQVEIQNEVAPEDNIVAQVVPNSFTSGLPSLDERLSIYASVMIRMGRMMEEFGNTQNEIKESLKWPASSVVRQRLHDERGLRILRTKTSMVFDDKVLELLSCLYRASDAAKLWCGLILSCQYPTEFGGWKLKSYCLAYFQLV